MKPMRNLLLAAVAAAALATPAVARDNSPYFGIDAGIMFPKDRSIDGFVDYTNTKAVDFDSRFSEAARIRYKKGYDIDVIGGYDLGMFRIEGELGYKHAKPKSIRENPDFFQQLSDGTGKTYNLSNFDLGRSGNVSVLSAMINGLVDVSNDAGIGGFAGFGGGYAKVKDFGESHGGFAWQLIAGIYAPVGGNVDVGLKYRFFHAPASNASDDFAFTSIVGKCGSVPCSGGVLTLASDRHFTSHSVLANVTFSFGAPRVAAVVPVAPPPPVVEAPATQTCPDGSVVLATATCPVPPPPPPPPVQRGERGE